ncbi:HAMP domain-containing sensor histidine kinase [Helicobacter sp. MIT 05-5294]|uniref:sensor histidine kinase n=1 Tax=Helicobacter sp. MIT 05-5294 TaxID=1548150 RepID=UPI00051FAA3D|nr:HAMP domain-containing sensor histidine kinase [Helicobacter sp. MIT 05-5294]TLD86522.1 HAMP domain-containing histidine kinase [Helicobacter sp. MIT 05-5294]
MIDQNLLESLSSSDKESFAKGLKELITQTYQVEKEFVELKALFEEVLDILPTAVWVLEQGGEIFYQNSLASEIPELLEKLDLSHDNRQEIELESQAQSRVYLVQANQKLNKLIISATDITSEKRRERLASMGQISAHLAHEIRNPVGSVALLASTLANRVDIKNKALVLEIKKSIWRVERIVKATLLFSKGVHCNKAKINSQSLKEELNESLQFYTYSKNIDFVFNFECDSLEADFDLLCIVLQNFLFNAIDAIEESEEESGIVEICCAKDSQNAVFRIYDSGKPIENPEILFEPFKSTKLKGNGLGLALSLQIIEAHGGTISLSKSDKKGFEILLPQG